VKQSYSLDDIHRDANAVLQQRALMNAGKLGLAAAGTGFGLRSLIALMQQSKRNLSGPSQMASQAARFISPPIAMPPEEQESQQETMKLSAASPMLDRLTKFLQGGYASRSSAIPWQMPLAAGAAGLGAYGGYRLADNIADRYYQNELDRDIKKEKDLFEKALVGDPTSKLASAIDELFDTVKQATVGDTLGTMAGLYGLYAGGTGLLAGKYTFDQSMKKRRINRINKALKQRRLMLHEQRPTPILVSDLPPDSAYEEM